MAAKQGLSAQISQASDDARRAVLSRAPTSIKSSWLANLNTTCTIKSAPPRTPEVMGMLATKSGWLVKRNEQHVWQRRWCCVVPHTFLYYFEAEPILDTWDEDGHGDYQEREGFSGGGLYRTAGTAAVENQDMLNVAVKDGIRARSAAASDHRLTDVAGDDAFASPIVVAPIRGPTVSIANLAPVGIIDLECYTSVNRSTKHDCVFELAGDPKTNPDLRSFYFQAASTDDCEIWTRAMLSDRHCALRDEREAYRQVCESFQLQLQHLSDLIDSAEGKADSSDREVYTIRSTLEQTRKKVMDQIRESFERKVWIGKDSQTESAIKDKFERVLETKRLASIRSMDSIANGSSTATHAINSSVSTIVDYLNAVVASYSQLMGEVMNMETTLSQTANIDKASLTDLKAKMERMESITEIERKEYRSRVSELETKVQEAQTMMEDSEKQLQTQLMEFTMFQSSAKIKLQEISQHKKILKKEVIDMRKKIDEIGSERDAALHARETLRLQLDTATHKNETLEKYIAKLENQVNVQQNIMEVMSSAGMSLDNGSRGSFRGGSSIVGKTVGPDMSSVDNCSVTSNNTNDQRAPVKKSHRLPPSIVPSGAANKTSTFHEKNHSFISTDFSSLPSTSEGSIHHQSDTILETSLSVSEVPTDLQRRRKNSKDNGTAHTGMDESEIPNKQSKVPPSISVHDVSDIDDEDDDKIVATGAVAVESDYTTNARTYIRKMDNDGNSSNFALNTVDNNQQTELVDPQRDDLPCDDGDDDDDSKSHISELTEDRTLKAIESAALFTGKDSSPMKKSKNPVPYIYSKEVKERTHESIDNAHNSAATTMNEEEDVEVTPALTKERLEENNKAHRLMNEANSVELSTSFLSDDSSGRMKLSVAQRARMEAQNSNAHSIQLSQILREQAEETSSQHGSFFSNRSMDERGSSVVKNMFSKLSVRLMESSDSAVPSSTDVGSNATVNTEVQNGDSTGKTKPSPVVPVTANPSRDPSPVKTSGETSLTLQQRMQMQRERQREVLREKGILR